MPRDTHTLALDFGHELVVDNFAGGGGMSVAIAWAFGRGPDIAINHKAEAIAIHAANHPETSHFTEDVYRINPRIVTGNRPIGLCHFSPDCTHHSKAAGGKPREQKIRGLAWVCLVWGAYQMPRCMSLENVAEFLDWGPLDANGKPIKEQKGRTFKAFVAALSTGIEPGHPDLPEIYQTLGADFPMHRLYAGLGYKVDWRILRACDFGAPTIRKRLFMFMRRDGLPIRWPVPTHGNPEAPGFATSGLQAYRTAANDAIDWSIDCPSIFERKKPLKAATLRRIAKGLVRYVINAKKPYIVNEGQISFITECANASTSRVFPVNEPLRTQVAGCKGGHFQLVTAFLAKHYTGAVGADVSEPMPTVTAIDHNSLVCAWMTKLKGDNIGAAANDPLATVAAGGLHHALSCAFLVKYYGAEKDGHDVDAPLGTVRTADSFGLVKVTIAGESWVIVDIGFRMLTPRELARAQGFPDNYILDPLFNGKRLSKREQVRAVGNSVSPYPAAAMLRANFEHEQDMRMAA